jgi:hypothetical protein
LLTLPASTDFALTVPAKVITGVTFKDRIETINPSQIAA